MAIFSRLPYSGIKAFVCLYPSTRGQVGSTYVHLGLVELCARVRAAELVPGVSIRIYLSEADRPHDSHLGRCSPSWDKYTKAVAKDRKVLEAAAEAALRAVGKKLRTPTRGQNARGARDVRRHDEVSGRYGMAFKSVGRGRDVMVRLWDGPGTVPRMRRAVAAAVESLHRAGIRVVTYIDDAGGAVESRSKR